MTIMADLLQALIIHIRNNSYTVQNNYYNMCNLKKHKKECDCNEHPEKRMRQFN